MSNIETGLSGYWKKMFDRYEAVLVTANELGIITEDEYWRLGFAVDASIKKRIGQ